MKKIIQLILFVVIIGLAYLLYNSIMTPINFQKQYDQRKALVVDRLKDIRDLQVAYKSVYNHYTSSFDSLVNFYKTGKMQRIVSIGSMDDSATVARTKAYESRYNEQQRLKKGRRPIKGEELKALADMSESEIAKLGLAVRIPKMDDVKSVVLVGKPNFNIDEISYVPGVEVDGQLLKPKFDMQAKIHETGSKVLVPLFEASTPDKVFLNGLNVQQIVNLIDKEDNLGKFQGLKVGDINTPNNNAGNWE